MDAIALQSEPAGRSQFKEYEPWHFGDQRYAGVGRVGFGDTIPHVGSAVALVDLDMDFLKANLGSRSLLDVRDAIGNEEHLSRSPSTASTDSNPPGYSLPSSPGHSAGGSPWLSSGFVDPASACSSSDRGSPAQTGYDFSFVARQAKPRLSLKRRRAVSDVDGPDTASQGCKKRRLRRYMVTSRLSRPFSQPATHIINREFVACGNKQFLKLAAIVSARRTGSAASTPAHHANHPGPSTLLRRAAAWNRFRLSVNESAAERDDDDGEGLATYAASLQHSHCMGPVVGARFPVTSSPAPLPIGLAPAFGTTRQSVPPFQSSLAAADARPRPTAPRLKAAEAARLKLPPLPPKDRAVRPPVLWGSARISHPELDLFEDEGLVDQEVAFPSSEHESRYEPTDEPDDVYADFGVIFGGGSADDESSDDEQDHYEDYMDDLDGIPWTAR